jgi:predicted alpha/beta-fold hydrolase
VTPPRFSLSPFQPAWWLPGGHLQTLGGKYLRRPGPFPLRRERIDTPDGDFLVLDFGPDRDPAAPLVLLLHGLEGFTRRPYMIQAAQVLTARGMATVGLNFRSCSGEPNLCPRLYHSGDTEDVVHVLRILKGEWPGRPLGAVGFSLGGNVLLKLMGERDDGGRGLLQGAVGISVPYDLASGALYMQQGPMGWFYTRYFLRSLKAKVQAKERQLQAVLDLEKVYGSRTLVEFDDHATGPLHGFRDAAEYYRRSSSNQFLPDIRVPTLLFHARNDPFLPPRAIPHQAVQENPWLFPAFARQGGHVGFLGGTVPGLPTFWSDQESARFLEVMLKGKPS